MAALAATDTLHTVHLHIELGRPIDSPLDFAQALGVELERVTKSVLLRDASSTTRYLVAVASMPSRLDLKRLAKAAGTERLSVASLQELEQVLGYPPKGVSPFGVSNASVAVEAGLLSLPTVTVGGGAEGVEIEVSPSAVADLPGAVVASFAQ